MPTYEYACEKGHITQDFVQRIKLAKKTIKCKECGLVANKILSAGSFLFSQPGGTYSGAKKEGEVRGAMADFASGKGKKTNDD